MVPCEDYGAVATMLSSNMGLWYALHVIVLEVVKAIYLLCRNSSYVLPSGIALALSE